MENGKAFYASQLKKAAENCEEVLKDLKRGFDKYYPFISVLPGYHALSGVVHKNVPHTKGEPDILIRDVDSDIIAGIEVTGSDRIFWRPGKTAWVGAHKVEHANNCGYPVSYVLCYQNGKYFLDNDRVLCSAPRMQTKIIGGYAEHFHIVPFHYVQSYETVNLWLMDIVKRRMA